MHVTVDPAKIHKKILLRYIQCKLSPLATVNSDDLLNGRGLRFLLFSKRFFSLLGPYYTDIDVPL